MRLVPVAARWVRSPEGHQITNTRVRRWESDKSVVCAPDLRNSRLRHTSGRGVLVAGQAAALGKAWTGRRLTAHQARGSCSRCDPGAGPRDQA